MLKKILAGSVVTLIMILVIANIVKTPEQTEKNLPTVPVGGFPPPSAMTEFVGNEISQLVDTGNGSNGVSKNKINPEYVKYQKLQILGYGELYAYVDDLGAKDILLSKEKVMPDLTGDRVLYSGKGHLESHLTKASGDRQRPKIPNTSL